MLHRPIFPGPSFKHSMGNHWFIPPENGCGQVQKARVSRGGKQHTHTSSSNQFKLCLNASVHRQNVFQPLSWICAEGRGATTYSCPLYCGQDDIKNSTDATVVVLLQQLYFNNFDATVVVLLQLYFNNFKLKINSSLFKYNLLFYLIKIAVYKSTRWLYRRIFFIIWGGEGFT